MLNRCLVGLALSVFLGACAPPPNGALSPRGFQHALYGYRIRATSGGALLPNGWLLDNLYGEPGDLHPKETADYKTTLYFDYDGDGNSDAQKPTFVHDLRWVHERHRGVIWVRSVPVSDTLRHVDLDVMVADYIDEISGAGYEGIAFGSRHGVAEHRYVAKLLHKTPGTLAGQEAIDAELEVANSEQLKLDSNARWQHVRLLLARGPIDDVEGGGGLQPDHKFPVVLILGYANGPDHYAEGAPDFESLVSRFEIGGHTGFSADPQAARAANHTPDVSAAPSPAPVMSGPGPAPIPQGAPPAPSPATSTSALAPAPPTSPPAASAVAPSAPSAPATHAR